MRNEKYAIWPIGHIYGRIAKIAAQLSNGLVNSAMGQMPCSTERISSNFNMAQQYLSSSQIYSLVITSYFKSVEIVTDYG